MSLPDNLLKAIQLGKTEQQNKTEQQSQITHRSTSVQSSNHATNTSNGYLNKHLDNTQKTKSHTPSPSSAQAGQSISRVDISIAGTPHRISCPSDEVNHLHKVADNINQALRDIRRHVTGKNPSNEELLVLHCLDLYDQLSELKHKDQERNIEEERACALLDKMIKNANTLL